MKILIQPFNYRNKYNFLFIEHIKWRAFVGCSMFMDYNFVGKSILNINIINFLSDSHFYYIYRTSNIIFE